MTSVQNQPKLPFMISGKSIIIEINLANLVRKETCFNNPSKTICIDLLVTNRPEFFQSNMVIETGLSDLSKICVTVMKMHYN